MGGRFAIIVDNEASEDPKSVLMVDDGRGSDLHSPAFFIGYEHG